MSKVARCIWEPPNCLSAAERLVPHEPRDIALEIVYTASYSSHFGGIFCYSMYMEKWVIGIDEVGRGPIAGPVCVCAVAIPQKLYEKASWSGLTDSKVMTVKSRQVWFSRAMEMKKQKKIRIAIATQSAKVIDQKGISSCIRACIARVLAALKLNPVDCMVLLDGGLKAPEIYVNQQTIVRGDLKKKAISLASVVAKVSRDKVMDRFHTLHPEYFWQRNKGYGTREHYYALKNKGFSELHRMSFLKRIIDK